jgi:hypothetical protein
MNEARTSSTIGTATPTESQSKPTPERRVVRLLALGALGVVR